MTGSLNPPIKTRVSLPPEPPYPFLDPALVSPPVAPAIDVLAWSLAEIWRTEDEDLEAFRTGLVPSPRTGRDAHGVPLPDLDDLVVELHPSAPAHDHVYLLLLFVRVAVRKAIARRHPLVAEPGLLERKRLGRQAELQVRRAIEPGADIFQVPLEVPEREWHGLILWRRGGCDDSSMQSHWLKAVGHARGPLPARWIEEGRTGVLREGGFPRRPSVREDDRLVLYASVWRRVFGVVVAVGEAYRVEHPRWPWRIAVEPLLVVPDLDLAPPIESIGVAARSMSQQSHIRLEPHHYRQAVEALGSIAL
jgi:hypothetical protein